LSLLFLCVKGSSDVLDLNPTTFKSEVLESDIPVFVEFFAPWCGHCQRLAPEWEKAATNLKGIVPLAKVDCTVHQSLCSQYGVQGYPSIKVFSEKGKNVQDYQQARQASAIVRYATDILPNNVVRIKDVGTLESFLGEMPDIPHLLLFTTKSDVAPLLKSLSASFKGRIAFGQVKQEVTEVVQKYSIDSFPKIILLQGDVEPIVYDGAINPEELNQFVSSYAGETVSSAPPPPPPQRRAAPKSGKDASYVEFNVDNFESECTGYCIVGFVDTETSDSGRVVKAEQQKVLDYIINNFKSDGKFKFGWVDKQSQDTLVSKFSVDSNTPTLLVYHAKRSKYVKSASFEEKDCFRTVEHVLTGDAHYTSLQ